MTQIERAPDTTEFSFRLNIEQLFLLNENQENDNISLYLYHTLLSLT